VKIRGYRIEPGEVEAAMLQHEGVGEAVVLSLEDAPGERRLAGYAVADAGAAPTLAELRGFLRERLPGYMVPSFLVFVEDLPLTPSGKVDRRALPAPDGSRQGVAEPYVAPRNSVEAVLAGIWSELLRVDEVGVHDNFFDLGGHSLLATQVVSRIAGVLRVELPLRAVFESPSVTELSSTLFERSEEPGAIEAAARIALRVAQLSDDEVRELVGEEIPRRTEGPGR
jgi:hypothetical protein